MGMASDQMPNRHHPGSIRRRIAVIALGCAIASVSTARGRADVSAPGATAVAGRYRLGISTRQGQHLIDAAIDRSVQGLFFLIRGIARRRLTATNRLSPTLDISFPPHRIRVVYEAGRFVYETPDDGRGVRVVDPSGEEHPVCTHRLRGGRLYEVFRTDRGSRTNVFEPTADGRGLTMTTTVHSPQLPGDVTYRLPYVRR